MRTHVCRSNAVTLVCIAAVLALVALVAGCGGVNNSPTSSASGVVLNDQTLQPVVGARVTLAGATATTQPTTGAFSFANASIGNGQTLSVTAAGFQAASATVNVASGGNALGVIYLKPVVPAGTGWITGKIVFTGAAVVGATVSTPTQTGLTKADGTYALYGVPAAENVQVSATDGAGDGA